MSHAPLSAFVRGAALWSPRYPNLSALLAATPAAEPQAKANAALLPKRMRGRASQLLRGFAEVLESLAEGGADLSRLPIVYGSALGELDTTVALLKMMWEGEGALSPVRFQASVHSNAGGQLSIACGNRGFSTAVAAGRDTVGAARCEGLGCLAAGHPRALVVVGDEDGPSSLTEVAGVRALAVGFDLVAESHPSNLGRLDELSWVDRPGHPDAQWARCNAIEPALELLRALHGSGPARVALGSEPGGYYEVAVQPRQGS